MPAPTGFPASIEEAGKRVCKPNWMNVSNIIWVADSTQAQTFFRAAKLKRARTLRAQRRTTVLCLISAAFSISSDASSLNFLQAK